MRKYCKTGSRLQLTLNKNLYYFREINTTLNSETYKKKTVLKKHKTYKGYRFLTKDRHKNMVFVRS